MDEKQARGGHCTRGGTIASGRASCQCGAWSAADYSTAAERVAARKQHLAEVVRIRMQVKARRDA